MWRARPGWYVVVYRYGCCCCALRYLEIICYPLGLTHLSVYYRSGSFQFFHAHTFNQDISNWDVRKVEDFSEMVRVLRALNFNHDTFRTDPCFDFRSIAVYRSFKKHVVSIKTYLVGR